MDAAQTVNIEFAAPTWALYVAGAMILLGMDWAAAFLFRRFVKVTTVV